MKIASLKAVITPEVGEKLAGYSSNDVSVAIHDDLLLSGICLDDGNKKVLVLSYDLLGLDSCYIKEVRRRCASIIGGEEADVLISCTHTHGGPHTRSIGASKPNEQYVRKVIEQTEQAVRTMSEFTECDVYFHSGKCKMNINRRVVFQYNHCEQLSDHRDLEPLADGFCDQELGMLLFFDRNNYSLLHSVVNYAAHPLVAHTRGRSGLTITADYPGEFRKMMENESGAPCTFISGAAGDQFPIDSETGFEALPRMAYLLLREAVKGLTDATRNRKYFKIEVPTLKSSIERFHSKFRPNAPLPECFAGCDGTECEVQLLGIGDTVCLVGVPGELLAEVGQEIKWHSPFRKAFIMYNSTAYLSYICHGNALIAGSYEANSQLIESRGALNLVQCAVDGMYNLLEKDK